MTMGVRSECRLVTAVTLAKFTFTSMPKRTLNQLSSWPNKKAKTLDDLPWKSLQWNVEADDGILQLEEVEGVEVTYGQDGRLASFNLVSMQQALQALLMDLDFR